MLRKISVLKIRNIQSRIVFTGYIFRQPMCNDIEKRVEPKGHQC